MHKYYSYSKEELLNNNPKINIKVMEDNEVVFKKIADIMADEIVLNNKKDKKTVFICPVGPIGQYHYFVERVNSEKINLKNVWFINMDEYLDDNKNWISIDNKLSFRGFMKKNLYDLISENLIMPENQRVFPDPKNLDYIPSLIKELGGVDICFGGIGINGHVAFNEANPKLTNEEFLKQKTRVLEISRETKVANAIGDLHGAIEDMPKYCITIGMDEIYNSRKIILGCFRDWHRAVVRRASYGEVSSDFPVSLLTSHKDLKLLITELVAK